MNILNSKEAFEAMMAGRNIMCRAIGESTEFDDLNQFPATIFAMPGYEFCIKVETIEVAGITFTKPLTLEDVREGQDVYTIDTYGPGIYISEFGKMTCTALIDSINSGFAQRDAENAKLQLQAISKILGRELSGDCLVVRLGAEGKTKKRRSRKTVEPAASDVDQTDVPAGPGDTTSNIEKQPEAEPVQPTGKHIDPEELKKQYLLRLHKLTTTEEVMQLRYEINPDNRLSKTQITYLNVAAEQQIAKIENSAAEQAATSTEKNEPNVQNSTSNDVEEKVLSVDELKRLQLEAESLIRGTAVEAVKTAEEKPVVNIFSATKRDQMIEHINGLESLESLKKYAPSITTARSSMHPEHHQAVLSAYAERDMVLAQQDLLEGQEA